LSPPQALVSAHSTRETASSIDDAPSALAVAVLFKGFLGALFPVFGLPMYVKLGPGWASTLLAFSIGAVNAAALLLT
jgi:hypothetical protein